jgi:hypothetical protein
VFVDQNGISPSKLPDAGDNLLDLFLRMNTRVVFARPELAGRYLGNWVQTHRCSILLE